MCAECREAEYAVGRTAVCAVGRAADCAVGLAAVWQIVRYFDR